MHSCFNGTGPSRIRNATFPCITTQYFRAYELLSDPDRRRLFDNYGITEDAPNFREKHDYSQYNRFDSGGGDGYDGFFDFLGTGGGGSDDGGGDGEHRIFHKSSITSRAYYHSVLPKSAKQPYLIMFYSDWCFSCSKVEPTWAKLVEELEPVGFGLAAVHTEHEKELARKMGAKELPHMVLLLDGKVVPFKDMRRFSTASVLDFIRRKLPYRMVDTVTDTGVLEFLSGWMDNRVRVLIFGHVSQSFLSSLQRFLTLNPLAERRHSSPLPCGGLPVPQPRRHRLRPHPRSQMPQDR